MIGIQAIASYVPDRFESNLEKLAKFDLDEAFLREKIGIEYVSRVAPEQQPSDMCRRAFESLITKVPVEPENVECIIVVTQNPDSGGLPHVSARIHGLIGGGEDCACFDIGLGCSGYVYGISVAKALMEANGLKLGVLFTADPYSKIVDPNDRNTALLFGDAATATLLSADGEWVPRRFKFGTRGRDGNSLKVESGRLCMNGRAVFNFSATVVPVQIKALLGDCGYEMEDIDLFFLHQGSKYIVDNIAQRLGLPADRVPTNLLRQGNTVSSSIPLLMEGCLGNPSYQRFVMAGFGVGLSWASCLLERRPQILRRD